VKKVLFVAMLLSMTGMAYANCGNDNGNGNGCSGNTGPQGPAGNNGLNGTNGTNGTDGINGTNGSNGTNGASGKDGANGRDSSTKATFIAGVSLRLFDTRLVSMSLFDDYALNPQQNRANKRVII